MIMNIRGEKLTITKAMEEYAKDKISKLNKYVENAEEVNAHVLAKVSGREQKVEVTIPLKSFILRAEEVSDDFYSAIDLVVDKLERQIRKNKTRLKAKKIKEAKEFIFDYAEEDEIEDKNIVKRKSVELKPMSDEEAIIQMELLGHQFYLYKDIVTNNPTVLYKRKDGNYGIIDGE
ncbi:MAG: ribosome-associated translation inhibitor RaiA [Bacilli bacterium]|nr:ribosome-associated translation inhibitor RaiA [Bacilli bacterium]